MVNFNYSTDIRLLLPEVIWLEPEHFEQATEISSQMSSEALRWSTYLKALALFAFEQWLQEKTPAQPVHREAHAVESMSYLKNLPEEAPAAVLSQLKVGEFKYGLIATECLLDEVVSIPQAAIDRPELAAHFYVVLEVDEEQAQVIVRGFLRYDELVNYQNSSNLPPQNGGYQLPLSLFDPEPNHLLFYSYYLEASAIPLPEPAQNSFFEALQSTRTKLSQWLQGIIDEGWSIDTLLNPEANLAWNTRNASKEVKGGKLINLGMQLGAQTVALLVTVMPEESEKVGILIQLYPRGERALPPNLQLSLLSKAEKTLQSAQSRSQDNYIQLKRFKGKPGTRFSVEVSIGDVSVSEEFEL